MALSNSQYNAIMREYGEQQLQNKYEQDRRISEVYTRIPRIRELEQELVSISAACARRALGGDTTARAELKQEQARAKAEKLTLLSAAGFAPDYMEMRYRCQTCEDTGYAAGKRCHCFERTKLKLLYAQSNLENVLQRENFNTFSYRFYDDSKIVPMLGITELDMIRMVVKRCQEFANNFKEKGGNLLFTGSTGVGKTFLTNCIAKELIDRYLSVIYLSSNDLFEIFSKYKFSYDTEDELEDTYRYILDCDMLIIDDLGTEMNNTFVSSQLFYCINERINRNRGTIISTNLSMDQLRDAYSDRVTSRLMSHYMTIPLYGGDIRMKKKQSSRD